MPHEPKNSVEQIHVRVPPELHRAIKTHCAANGLSVQDWARNLFLGAIKNSEVIRILPSARSDGEPDGKAAAGKDRKPSDGRASTASTRSR